MRPALCAAILALATALSACGRPADFSTATLIGQANTAALDAAADCRPDDAMALARQTVDAGRPSEALFALLVQYALFTEAGQEAEAQAAVDTALADPQMNPNGVTTAAEMQAAADATLRAIRTRRAEDTGSPTC